MREMNFVIPIQSKSDAEIFTSLPGLKTEIGSEKNKGLTGVEFAATLVVSLISSAAYDTVKLSVKALTDRLRKYFTEHRPERSTHVISFNGIQYKIESEADLEAFIEDINDAIEETDAHSVEGD